MAEGSAFPHQPAGYEKNRVEPGAIVGVGTGEIIPANGVVVMGVAWVKSTDGFFADADGEPEDYLDIFTVGKGRRVRAGDVVQIGELHICIDPFTP